MEKRIELDNGNKIIYSSNPGYCCDTIGVIEGYLENDELKKDIEFWIWDDICFKAWTKDNNINTIEFAIDVNHPLYFCFKHLLNDDNELIIDDDDTYERLKRYLIVKKVDDVYKVIFINNLDKVDYIINEKFRVFIKNIGPDCRSKITDWNVKKRIVIFFREMEKTLMEDYHQITLEEYLEINKVKKRIKRR